MSYYFFKKLVGLVRKWWLLKITVKIVDVKGM